GGVAATGPGGGAAVPPEPDSDTVPAARSDNEPMRIRAAKAAELPGLQAIERAAGQIFADFGMPEIAQYDPWPLPVMAASQQAGLLWVIVDQAAEPVAYLIARLVAPRPQGEQ